MPQIALSAASYAAAAAPAVAATAAKATVMASLKSVALSTITNLAFSAAMSALNPQVGPGGKTDEWVLSPDGPIPFAAGRIGVPGSVVYRKTYGPDLMYYGIPSVLSGAGPIDGFEGFMADDETVAFDGNGKAISSQYTGELWYRNRLGSQPDTALPSPVGLKGGATLPGWTSAHKLSGKASYLIVMGENSKGTAYPTGEIKPIITLRGLKGWDPRLDSTYPGGSGPCRLHDPSTWVYLRRPGLWALKWALGLWEGPSLKGAPAHGSATDYQVGGIGAKLSGIDVPAFVNLENICDANDWIVAAYPSTDDDKAQVMDAFLQAGGAVYAQRGGKISCIQRAAPRTSVVTISARDTAGPLEIDTAASRIDRINTIRPRFWSEAHRWQLTAIDEVTATSYRTEDGAIRTRGIDFPYVTSAVQAAQLAALQIANTREGIIGVVPLKPHLQRIRPGDAFTITEAGFVLNGLKCLCLNTDYDPATGVVRVSFVSETDGKYPFAMGQSPTPPAPPVLTPVDPTFVSPPEAGDWTITPRPPAASGGQLPGFDLGGIVSNDTATAIIVEYGPSATGPWKQAYQGPPTVTNIPIDGLQPGADYFIAIQYQRNQNYSAREVYGPYTAPGLIGDVMPNAPGLSQIKSDIEAAFGDIFAVDALLADARADIDAQGVEIAAARGGQPNLNSRIVQVNQARIDGDTSNATAISLVQARTANTEADVIDLENALATETLARAQAVQQVTAQVAGAALNKNSTYANWPTGQSMPDFIGSFGSGLTVSRGVGKVSPNSIILEAAAGSSNNGVEVAYTATNWNGRMPVVAGAPAYWVIDYKIEIGTGGLNGPMLRFLLTNAATGASLGSTIQKPLADLHTSTGDDQIIEGSYFFRCDLPAGSPPASARLALFARAGAVANYNRIIAHKLAVRPATAAEISAQVALPATQATVTTNSLAIVDLENQQALAMWQVKTAASGGKPTVLSLISSTFGSAIAMAAEQIYFGDNTVFDDASDQLRTVTNGVRRVIAWGAAFGSGADAGQLTEWEGPDSIALNAMTRANATFFRANAQPYVGGSGLNAGVFTAQANLGTAVGSRTSAGQVTTATVTLTASGNTGVLTYAWSQIGGNEEWTITTPTGASTTFRVNVSTPGEQKRATFACRISDSGTGKTITVIVGGAAIYNV